MKKLTVTTARSHVVHEDQLEVTPLQTSKFWIAIDPKITTKAKESEDEDLNILQLQKSRVDRSLKPPLSSVMNETLEFEYLPPPFTTHVILSSGSVSKFSSAFKFRFAQPFPIIVVLKVVVLS
uniref:Uncharacterized protein n=1 Tax=Romanomermis culicivorax TaxID=13658 RepID=A0A915KHM4_ROMCU